MFFLLIYMFSFYDVISICALSLYIVRRNHVSDIMTPRKRNINRCCNIVTSFILELNLSYLYINLNYIGIKLYIYPFAPITTLSSIFLKIFKFGSSYNFTTPLILFIFISITNANITDALCHKSQNSKFGLLILCLIKILTYKISLKMLNIFWYILGKHTVSFILHVSLWEHHMRQPHLYTISELLQKSHVEICTFDAISMCLPLAGVIHRQFVEPPHSKPIDYLSRNIQQFLKLAIVVPLSILKSTLLSSENHLTCLNNRWSEFFYALVCLNTPSVNKRSKEKRAHDKTKQLFLGCAPFPKPTIILKNYYSCI